MKRSFENWLWEDIEQEFGLQKTKKSALLEEWLTNKGFVLTALQTELMTRLQVSLEVHYQDWNEEELKLNFIAPLLTSVVNYSDSQQYQPFAERTLKAEIGNFELSGTIDWMLASGKQIPRKPFFFLQEYKRTKMADSDPLGQLLIAMLVAQTLDEQKRPVFGAYIMGKDWHFIVLDNNNTYAESKRFHGDEVQDLLDIIAILENTKHIAQKYIFNS